MAKLRGGTEVAGDLTATGTIKAAYFDSTSSREKKKDIVKSEINALQIVKDTTVVDFRFKEQTDDYIHTGFIAEDTHERMTGPDGDAMSIADTVGVLIKAIQELNEKIEKLERRE